MGRKKGSKGGDGNIQCLAIKDGEGECGSASGKLPAGDYRV